MKGHSSLFALAAISISLAQIASGQSKLLDNAQHFAVELPVNDVVYDRFRDVLYASIPSSAGSPHGNSIATIDPRTGAILSSTFVGSEPNSLAISDDASRVYVGIDGARSMRWWQPQNDQLGSLRPLMSPSPFPGPGVAHNMAVVPGRPDTVVVSIDELGSTANGDLVVFDDDVEMEADQSFENPNHIGFFNATMMYGFDDSNTGFTGSVFNLNGLNLQISFCRTGMVGEFDVESTLGSDGNIYFTDGTAAEALSLLTIGTFIHGLNIAEALVAPVPLLDYTYFVGPDGGSEMVLKVFDTQTFLQLDSVELGIAAASGEDRGEMIIAGKNRLAFLWKPQEFDGPGGTGILHVVSEIPVSATLVGDVNQDGIFDLFDVTPFVDLIVTGEFQPEADINCDGDVNLLDVDPFVALLKDD